MLEPQVNYENHSALYDEQTKLSFLIKRECFGDVLKVSSDFDALWSVAKSPKIPQMKALKAIQLNSRTLRESTNMCRC